MTKVGVFSLGYLQADGNKLCKLLSAVKGPYVFEYCTEISNLGDPDLHGYAYSDDAFDALIKPHRGMYDICAVLTSVPIERNFFTRSTPDHTLIIATFYQSDELLQASGRVPEEYAALAICQELVSIEFQKISGLHWRKLFHKDPRGCLFDFAGIKQQKVAKLSRCSICDPCLGNLARKNLNRKVTTFATSLLNHIRKPTFKKALHTCVATPGLSFVYGGLVISAAVNLLSSVIMADNTLNAFQKNLTWLLVSSIVLFPVGVYIWLIFRELRRRVR